MNQITRRQFLQRTSAAGAALAFPNFIPARLLGANAPSKRVNVGHIGVGGQGTGLLNGFLGCAQGQSVATCDPIKERREAVAKRVEQRYATDRDRSGYKGCRTYNDFREMIACADIDAVVIATPDHWHVPAAIAAVRAGKDVYVEKPLGISMEHNKATRETVHLHGAVFQYGTQQRSFSQHCGFACELVRNG
ncbi:MAG: Gfo/Idh/MocA family oxidoreductase, partial [Verrucomicrobia bacterium]|nr:Gfo/Idh/MocA family oxidoreductase [Verrucomicrobiota bacterium]